jgi:hypothetical protein
MELGQGPNWGCSAKEKEVDLLLLKSNWYKLQYI